MFRAGVVALVLCAALVGCGGSNGLTDQDHRDFVSGCSNSGQNSAGCECLYQQLTTTQGVNTNDKMNAIYKQAKSALASGNRAAIPAPFVNAARACAGSLRGAGA